MRVRRIIGWILVALMFSTLLVVAYELAGWAGIAVVVGGLSLLALTIYLIQ